MSVARRKFLSLLAIAPAAVPVAAKEAASRMGLSAVTTMTATAANVGSSGYPSPIGEKEYLSDRISQFWTDEMREQRIENARHQARLLDADLASMRSMSPSAAYAIQRGRSVAREERREMGWLQASAKKLGIPTWG